MYGYVVLVDDNFHHMDEGEQYELGEFDSCESALAACKKVVDDFLLSFLQPTRYGGELWTLFKTFGDSAILVTADPECRFSAWDYAERRCKELSLGTE